MIIVFFVILMNEIVRNNLKVYNLSVNFILNIFGKLVLKLLIKLVYLILLVFSLGLEIGVIFGYSIWKYRCRKSMCNIV